MGTAHHGIHLDQRLYVGGRCPPYDDCGSARTTRSVEDGIPTEDRGNEKILMDRGCHGLSSTRAGERRPLPTVSEGGTRGLRWRPRFGRGDHPAAPYPPPPVSGCERGRQTGTENLIRDTDELVVALLPSAFPATPQTVIPPPFLDSLPSVTVTATSNSMCENPFIAILDPSYFACSCDFFTPLMTCSSVLQTNSSSSMMHLGVRSNKSRQPRNVVRPSRRFIVSSSR
jgi:hypothetical protein